MNTDEEILFKIKSQKKREKGGTWHKIQFPKLVMKNYRLGIVFQTK